MTTASPLEQITDSMRIPTLSASVERIRAVLAKPDVEMTEVVAAFQTDPPLAAKVLKIANSVSYGRQSKTTSLQSAIPALGLRTLSMIVLRAGVLAAYENTPDCEQFSLKDLWKHSTLTAQVSENLARRCRRRKSDMSPQDYYTCGLLHDIGKIVLYDNLGEQYLEVLSAARTGAEGLEAEETRLLGMNHADAGSVAAVLWRLPEPIPGVIRCHHKAAAWGDMADTVKIIACADEIANAVAAAGSNDPKAVLAQVHTRPLGIGEAELLQVIADATASRETIEI